MVLLPQYLETLLNYPSMQAGLALSPRGLGSLLLTFLVGIVGARVDVRKLLIIGFGVCATTMFMFSGLNLNAGYWDIFWPQVMQGGAMACVFIPLSAAAMSHISREKMGNATSIFNLMRNIGGSVGIAVMTTLLARRQQFHQNRLVEHLLPGQPRTYELLHQFTGFFMLKGTDPSTASRRALGALYGMVQQQAAMLSFVEAFKIMGIVFLAMIPMVFLLKDPKHNHAAKDASKPQATTQSADEAPVELVHM
jgi:DHA2 family multidrug resistance protein